MNGQLEKSGGGTSYNAFNFDNFSVQYGVCAFLCKERVHDTFLWSRGVGFRGWADGGVQYARGRGGEDTRLHAQPSGCTALGMDVSATLDAGMSHYTGAQMFGQYILAEYNDER